MMMTTTTTAWLVVAALQLLLLLLPSEAWHACNSDGSSVCPDGNACCPTNDDHGSFTCVSGHNVSSGVCCLDTTFSGATGCGQGFTCARQGPSEFCEKIDAGNAELPDRVPRYRLCSLDRSVLQQVHGFPVDASETSRLAYLSTMGALDAKDDATLSRHVKVETLIVMIHGSGRNADDYICATMAATPNPDTTLIVAPWFIAPQDLPVNLSDTAAEPLVWAEEGRIYHTWRYGADAINAPVSAYGAVDALIDYVAGSVVQFPKLERIIIAGHSAGGQYTQRYALLSNAYAFESPLLEVRIVVANPKSFCYLDGRRCIDDNVLRLPTADEIGNCSTYNEWEWGFDQGEFLPTPYKDDAIQEAGGVDAVIRRYSKRDVVYLAGELDVLLNGDCQAQLQGPYRRKRSEHYFETLKDVYGHQVHHRLLVAGVHHDHALMLQSPEGQKAMFGSFSGNDL